MMPVGTKAAATFFSTSQSRNFLQYRTTTARMAPLWMAISKVLANSDWATPRSRDARMRCAVEEMGRNSVKPSTTPKMRAARSLIIYRRLTLELGAQGQDQRAEGRQVQDKGRQPADDGHYTHQRQDHRAEQDVVPEQGHLALDEQGGREQERERAGQHQDGRVDHEGEDADREADDREEEQDGCRRHDHQEDEAAQERRAELVQARVHDPPGILAAEVPDQVRGQEDSQELDDGDRGEQAGESGFHRVAAGAAALHLGVVDLAGDLG